MHHVIARRDRSPVGPVGVHDPEAPGRPRRPAGPRRRVHTRAAARPATRTAAGPRWRARPARCRPPPPSRATVTSLAIARSVPSGDHSRSVAASPVSRRMADVSESTSHTSSAIPSPAARALVWTPNAIHRPSGDHVPHGGALTPRSGMAIDPVTRPSAVRSTTASEASWYPPSIRARGLSVGEAPTVRRECRARLDERSVVRLGDPASGHALVGPGRSLPRRTSRRPPIRSGCRVPAAVDHRREDQRRTPPSVGAGDAARAGGGGLGATTAAADGAALGEAIAVHGFTTPATTNTTMPSATATRARSRRSLTGRRSGTGLSSVGTLTDAPADARSA